MTGDKTIQIDNVMMSSTADCFGAISISHGPRFGTDVLEPGNGLESLYSRIGPGLIELRLSAT